jgi:hypothetical protein
MKRGVASGDLRGELGEADGRLGPAIKDPSEVDHTDRSTIGSSQNRQTQDPFVNHAGRTSWSVGSRQDRRRPSDATHKAVRTGMRGLRSHDPPRALCPRPPEERSRSTAAAPDRPRPTGCRTRPLLRRKPGLPGRAPVNSGSRHRGMSIAPYVAGRRLGGEVMDVESRGMTELRGLLDRAVCARLRCNGQPLPPGRQPVRFEHPTMR